MFAHAALLALSGEPYQYTESRGGDLCIGLTVDGSSARTDTSDYDGNDLVHSVSWGRVE
jgi:hypothetical protein